MTLVTIEGMEKDMIILVLSGSTRPQRKSILVSQLITDEGQKIDGIQTVLVDPIEFSFPGDGNDSEGKDPKYSQLTNDADAFFIVTPEYNHSFPGSLKRMLDSELENYIHKPVAFAGVSSGHWGGVRAVESLVSTVREMGLVATFTDVYFPNVQDLFDVNGMLLQDNYRQSIRKVYDELIWMAVALKNARNNT